MKPKKDQNQIEPTNQNQFSRTVRKKKLFPFIFTFIIAFAFWIILSGKFDPFHISLGIIACAIVAFVSGDLLIASTNTKSMPRQWLGFIRYLPWILYQVFLANIHVLKLVFHPRMMTLIDPKIIRFKSCLNNEMALFIFANSITLTPGTITVSVSMDGDFRVHAIDKASSEPLPGKMEAKVARIFSK